MDLVGSDRGSDGSFNLMGSMGSIGSGIEDTERKTGPTSNRNTALAKLRERQSKCVQALHRTSTGPLSAGLASEEVTSVRQGLANQSRQVSGEGGGGTPAGASTPVTSYAPPVGGSRFLGELTQVLQEMKQRQESDAELGGKILESVSSTSRDLQETSGQVAVLKEQLQQQGQDIQAMRSDSRPEAAAQLLQALQTSLAAQAAELESLKAQEESKQKELKSALERHAAAAAEASARSAQETSQQLASLSKSLESQAVLLEAVKGQESKSSKEAERSATEFQQMLQAQAAAIEEVKSQDASQRLVELSKVLEGHGRQIEALKAEETGRQVAEVSRALELQGRQVEAIRAQEAGQHLQELQRSLEVQARAIESLRSQEASQLAEIQRVLETNTTQLTSVRAQETGNHVVELQRLIEVQSRSIESLRAQESGQQLLELRKAVDLQSSQVLEALRSQDLEKRLAEMKRHIEAFMSPLSESAASNHQESLQRLEKLQLSIAEQDPQVAMKQLQTSLEAQVGLLESMRSQEQQQSQASSAAIMQLRQLIEDKPQGLDELQQLAARLELQDPREKLLEVQSTLSAQASALEELKAEETRRSSELHLRLEAQSQKLDALQEQDAKEKLLEVQTTLEAHGELLGELRPKAEDTQCLLSLQRIVESHGSRLEQLAAEVESSHQVHLEELRQLKSGLATQAQCDGLRTELEASRGRQASLEAEQKARSKAWIDEKERLEREVVKLQEREASLAEQLQQAIVTIPEPPLPEPEPVAEKNGCKDGVVILWRRGQASLGGRLRGRLGSKALPLGLLALALAVVLGIVLCSSATSAPQKGARRAWLGPTGLQRPPVAEDLKFAVPKAHGRLRKPWK
eukprot:TRINITY_DN110140_c0_g1_i1.p1 TRINITY_DN110140_c0_g1~~TRINITY_DN110140_c0_g1_i1.p1  ORF type:complete len:902 (-),score=299.51 TRINITY_DN110140_c0_g1_i1:34-2616(-)